MEHKELKYGLGYRNEKPIFFSKLDLFKDGKILNTFYTFHQQFETLTINDESQIIRLDRKQLKAEKFFTIRIKPQLLDTIRLN